MKELLALMATLCVIGCGGSQPEPAHASESKAEDKASSASERAAAAEPDEKPEPPAKRCTDGTCFACGAGFCPNGFYCDESAKGGASCAWLPACVQKSGCSCLSRAVSGCKCEDSEGGPHVKCD